MRVWQIPVRLATGAFILNSGLGKLKEADEETQKRIHGMASNAYPAFESMDPATFTKALGTSEVALGGALLLPFVSSGLAGAGLTAFSGGLVGLYMRTPGMRQHDSIRPSPEGLAVAKDSWMLAIGTGLVLDSIATKGRRRARRSKSRAAKAATRAATKAAATGVHSASRAGQVAGMAAGMAAAGGRHTAEQVGRSGRRAARTVGRSSRHAAEVVGRSGRTVLARS